MRNAQRFQLHFGPYRTPRFKRGSVVQDAARGDVRVKGISDAPIPWPVGRPDGAGGRPSVVFYKSLVRAVKKESNQAVAHWWGVSGQTVTKWRNTLRVPTTTKGTSRLRSAHALEPPVARGRAMAHAKSRNPVEDAARRAEIAAAKLGKKRPPHVLRALRKANLGRKPSPEARRKMSEAHRRRGTRPPWLNPAWTASEDELVRSLPPAEAVRQTGRTLSAVFNRRGKLKLKDGRATRHRKK